MPRSYIIKLALIAGLFAVGIFAAKTFEQRQSGTEAEDHSAHLANAVTEPDTRNGPAIGGEFTLIDQDGNPFDSKQLLGKYSLVFFGFTHCPDVCPLALTTLTEALQNLDGDQRARITPVFVTIDPDRDTPEAIKDYLTHFDPLFIGLTGTHAQIKQAAAAYKVYYSTANPDAEDYQVAHSGFIYFLSPDGKYIRHFSHSDSAETIESGLNAVLGEKQGHSHSGADHGAHD